MENAITCTKTYYGNRLERQKTNWKPYLGQKMPVRIDGQCMVSVWSSQAIKQWVITLPCFTLLCFTTRPDFMYWFRAHSKCLKRLTAMFNANEVCIKGCTAMNFFWLIWSSFCNCVLHFTKSTEQSRKEATVPTTLMQRPSFPVKQVIFLETEVHVPDQMQGRQWVGHHHPCGTLLLLLLPQMDENRLPRQPKSIS